MSIKRKNIICCYCGIREATTRDHIPPRGIFNRPRPNDLITVPCCVECNNQASKYDERFKAHLGMHVARAGGEGEKLFKEGVLRTLNHNKKIKNTIIQTMYPVHELSISDPKIKKGIAVPWDNEAHDLIIERIIRGLFFYHYKQIVPSDVIIQIYWFKEKIEAYDSDLYTNTIANGAFVYKYDKVEEAEFSSIWLFDFYSSHFAGGIILSREDKDIRNSNKSQGDYGSSSV